MFNIKQSTKTRSVHVYKIEQGIAKNPRMETLKQIADAFHVHLDDLVGRKLK